jgi:hypothetical protein
VCCGSVQLSDQGHGFDVGQLPERAGGRTRTVRRLPDGRRRQAVAAGARRHCRMRSRFAAAAPDELVPGLPTMPPRPAARPHTGAASQHLDTKRERRRRPGSHAQQPSQLARPTHWSPPANRPRPWASSARSGRQAAGRHASRQESRTRQPRSRHRSRSAAATRRVRDPGLKEFPFDNSLLQRGLTYCDVTTAPGGEPTNARDRVAEIVERYGADHVVARAALIGLPDGPGCLSSPADPSADHGHRPGEIVVDAPTDVVDHR